MDVSFPSTFVPGNESVDVSFPGTQLPSNFRALERTECQKRVTKLTCNKFKMIFADGNLSYILILKLTAVRSVKEFSSLRLRSSVFGCRTRAYRAKFFVISH